MQMCRTKKKVSTLVAEGFFYFFVVPLSSNEMEFCLEIYVKEPVAEARVNFQIF